MKDRIHFIDIAKGLLILMVILHHVTNNAHWTFGIETETFKIIDKVNLFYLCFFMQAFFLISGYCSKFTESLPIFVKKNLRQLILPAFIISIIVRLIRFAIYQDVSYIQLMLKPHFWVYAFGGYWFIYSLFFCRIIFWGMNKYIKRDSIQWTFLLLCLLFSVLLDYPVRILGREFCVPNIFFWRNTCVNLFFLALGFKFKSTLHNRNLLKISSLMFIVLYGIFSIWGGKITVYTMSSNIELFDLPEFLILAFLGSLFVVYISTVLKENTILETLGKYSLVVYLTHGLFLNLFIEFFNIYITPVGIFTSLCFYIIVSSLTIGCSWMTIMLFKSKYVSWILRT